MSCLKWTQPYFEVDQVPPPPPPTSPPSPSPPRPPCILPTPSHTFPTVSPPGNPGRIFLAISRLSGMSYGSSRVGSGVGDNQGIRVIMLWVPEGGWVQVKRYQVLYPNSIVERTAINGIIHGSDYITNGSTSLYLFTVINYKFMVQMITNGSTSLYLFYSNKL